MLCNDNISNELVAYYSMHHYLKERHCSTTNQFEVDHVCSNDGRQETIEQF